jgi:hypothetical protein
MALDDHDTEVSAYELGAGEDGENLGWCRAGGDIIILGFETKKEIPHAASYEECPMACGLQSANNAFCVVSHGGASSLAWRPIDKIDWLEKHFRMRGVIQSLKIGDEHKEFVKIHVPEDSSP